MEIRALGISAAAALLLAANLFADSPMAPSDQQIREAIKQLGEDRFLVREKAMQLLWNAGQKAEAALREASDDPNPETARRVRILIDRIAYRIEPGTPPEMVALMQKYKNGSPQEQVTILRDMLKLGSKSHPYLARLLDAVEPDRRKLILDQMAYDDWRILATLMAEGREEIVEQLLDRAIAVQIESIIPHYAAFYSGADKLKERTTQLRMQVEAKNNPYQARLLFALYRVADESDGMMWAAQKTQQPDWIRLLLQECGQWNELIQKYPPAQPAGLSQINGLGLTAAYQRLAEKKAEFEETVKKMEEYAGVKPDRANRPWFAAKALLVNEQPQAALDLLRRHEQYAILAELLMAQGQYAEALALSEKAAKSEKPDQSTQRYNYIILLLQAGENAKAKEWLTALAKDMSQTEDVGWPGRQIELESKLGLHEDAEKHLVAMLERNDGSYLGTVFSHMYPNLAPHSNLAPRGETLYRLLRQKYPQEKLAETLKRLRTIDNGTMPKKELAELLKSSSPNTNWIPQAWLGTTFEGMALTVFFLEDADLANTLLNDSNWQEHATTTAKILLADTLAQAKQWQAAANAYKKILEQDTSAPLPVFLHGWVLTQLGQQEEGQKWIVRAHRMVLGSESGRFYFHSALVQRGFVEDAHREVAIRRHLSALGSSFYSQVMNDAAHLDAEQGRYAQAAALQERNLIRFVATNNSYMWKASYSRVTCEIHIFRAKALLREGKKEEAFREIDVARQLHPTHLEIPIGLVPELERVGDKERAKELFDEIYAKWEQICRDYPNSADAHNHVAWLAVRCRRNLDAALEHSRKAVELAPSIASYRDTLAEVQFQRGEKAEAIELIKKCMKMPVKTENLGFYERQLRRFERGDPKEDPPREG
jgi:tetratricopeptide (TPR) repeat protein